jgi:hypothetical protein
LIGHALPAVSNSFVPAIDTVPCTGKVVMSVKSAVLPNVRCDRVTLRLLQGLPSHSKSKKFEKPLIRTSFTMLMVNSTLSAVSLSF